MVLGLSGSGKTTISKGWARAGAHNCLVEVLDGDVVRTHLSKGLSFASKTGTSIFVRICGESAQPQWVLAITAAISPYRAGMRSKDD